MPKNILCGKCLSGYLKDGYCSNPECSRAKKEEPKPKPKSNKKKKVKKDDKTKAHKE